MDYALAYNLNRLSRTGVGGVGTSDLRAQVISALFGSGEAGAFYDASVVSSLWKDTAGTIPVTTHGDLVARRDDLSGNGRHQTQANVADRPAYGTDGTLHWLDFDGAGDFLQHDGTASDVGPRIICAGFEARAGAGAETGNFVIEMTGAPPGSRLILGAPAGVAETAGYFDGAWNDTGLGEVDVEAKNVYTVLHRTTGGGFRANGALLFSDTPTEGAIPATLAAGRASGSVSVNSGSGKLYADVVVRQDIAAEALALLESFIASKTGVTL